MIDFSGQNVERAISLLHELLDKSPADARNRVRLLSLLNGQHNKEAFLHEVQKLTENCKPLEDGIWEQVCEMGRGLDPENQLFGAEHDADESDSKSPGMGDSEGTPEDRPAERRGGEDRRKIDRRKNVSTWTGDEQRYWKNRRQNFRREGDARDRRRNQGRDH